MGSTLTKNWGLSLIASALVLSGCGAASKPILQLNQAEKQVARAQAVNADNAPQAALYLKLAEDQLTEAKRLLLKSENELARHFLRRAAADAELAEALAREAEAKAETEEIERRLERVRSNRPSDR